MDNIAFDIFIKMPAVHLSGRHKIHLERLYFMVTEIDSVCATTSGEKYHVKKRMTVRPVKVFIMFLEIAIESLNHQVMSGAAFNGTDVINRNFRLLCWVCHHY